MMGSSMRRRRGKGGGGGRKKKGSGWGARKEGARGSGWLGRPVLVFLAVLLVGSGSGYLFATQVAFPAAPVDTTELTPVPDLRGMSVGEARVLIENRGFEAGRVDSIRHPAVPAGEIVGQTPLPGQLSLVGATVELTLSLGPEQRPVPDVTRLRADRALTVLRTTGFEVTVDSVQADEPAGQVVATRPQAGTRLTIPSGVHVTVSLGPPLVAVPELVGLQEEEARVILAERGLQVGEVENRARFGFGDGDVLETFPAAGDSIPRGSPVRLVIRRRSLLPGGGMP